MGDCGSRYGTIRVPVHDVLHGCPHESVIRRVTMAQHLEIRELQAFRAKKWHCQSRSKSWMRMMLG